MDPIGNILSPPNADPSTNNIPGEPNDDDFAGKKRETLATSIGAAHKRFYESREDLSKIIHEFKIIQNSNKKQCLALYKYMTSYMEHRCGDDIFKRRRVTFPDQQNQKPKSKNDENSIFRHLKLALQKLGESKEDLTYVISQIKFFNIGHKHSYHGKTAEIESCNTQPEETPIFDTEEETIPREPPQALNLWENLLDKLKNSVEREILFETRCVRVEKLSLHDSATMSLDKRRRKRKIIMTRKKEIVFMDKRKLNRTQIRETPPWRWGNNGRYFENVPNVPFVWKLIFDELEERDMHNIRLVSVHWKTIVESYHKFVYNAVLTDDTLKQIDASLYEFDSLSIGPLLNQIPESWPPGCFAEVKKLTFLSSVSQDNIERLSLLFQHLPCLACENNNGFRWLMPNICGFYEYRSGSEKLQPQPFGGQQLTRFELSFTTFSPWHCAVFIELVISDFPCLEDFTVRYTTDEKEPFGWTGQERNHFYEVYLSIFTFIAIHLHSLIKVTIWLAITAKTEGYDVLPFGIDLPWLPGFPNYEELVSTLETGSLEEINVHLCPWEQRGDSFWSFGMKLIHTQSKLKSVTIQNMGTMAPTDPIFEKSANSLESVSIKYPTEPFSCELIHECTNLREFTFVDKLWKMDRLDDIDQMPLCVQKITLDTYLYKLPDPIELWILDNLTNVEELILSGWAHAHVAVTYLALPKLKKLTIQNCFPSSVLTIKEMCISQSPEVCIRYERKRTCVTGELIIQIIRHNEDDSLTE